MSGALLLGSLTLLKSRIIFLTLLNLVYGESGTNDY